MRIFQVLSYHTTPGIKNQSGWLKNLYEPLIDLGHEVYLFNFSGLRDKKRLKTWSLSDKKFLEQEIIKTFDRENKKKPFDFFFSYLSELLVTPDFAREIKSRGVVTANFSCNNTHQFYLVEKLSPHFDFNLHSEKDAAEKFKTIGANPVWFPMAANPKYYRPYNLKREFDVTFVGQNYALRSYYIWHLLENGIDVRAWGPGWKRKENLPFLKKPLHLARKLKYLTRLALTSRPQNHYEISPQLVYQKFRNYLEEKYKEKFGLPLSDEEMIKIYSRSKISLGFLEVWDTCQPPTLKKSHLHLREFEAPMSGALYCTGYSEELAEFYEPDKEVLTYRNEEELLDKVKYYLTHPSEAEKIRQAGYKRAISCHTYQKRFQDLFKSIGF